MPPAIRGCYQTSRGVENGSLARELSHLLPDRYSLARDTQQAHGPREIHRPLGIRILAEKIKLRAEWEVQSSPGSLQARLKRGLGKQVEEPTLHCSVKPIDRGARKLYQDEPSV